METLHFAGRDVPPYAEYPSADSLVEGRTYFVVGFLDRDLTIPELQPFVFIGWNLHKGDERELYFQDARSFAAGIRFGVSEDEADDAEFHVVSADVPFAFEFERALDRLLYCSLTRGR